MNPLLGSMSNMLPQNDFSRIGDVVKMLRSGNPQQIAQNLMQQNPQFRAFVDANKGKTPEQVAKEHGVDLSEIMGRLR